MKMKRTVTARIYVFSQDAQHAEVTAATKSDLVQQVQALSGGSAQAAQLAKLAWTDERSDITVGQLRLACIGQLVRETWGQAPTQRPRKQQSKQADQTATEQPITPAPAAPDIQPATESAALLQSVEEQAADSSAASSQPSI